ncbi:glycosyltransferase family 4 protein [Ponticaulis profundi]|uniref:Glycosyltransferase family 4 protein n=1 Tax=Ponticaulis profundi TaxID=2665222 RepID=A0ABW1SBI3_9PROT
MAKSGLTVLQVIPELAAGGAERTTLEIVEALKAAGGRALVVSEGGRMEDELTQFGGELIRMPVKTKNPLAIHKHAGLLAQIIRQEGVDLIHARSRAPAWSALWAARRTGIPFVTTYHGAYGGKSAPKKLYNSVMARGDKVIANSDYIADHIRNTYRLPEARLITIPRGVDTHIFDPIKADPARVSALRSELGKPDRLLFILPGRLTSWKGQMVLIDALAELSDAEKAHFQVALIGDAQGRDDYLAALTSRIAENGLDDLVKITGHSSDMVNLYAAADLVLAPSTRPEAFGRIAIEAGAMQRPVIVSDHGGQRETVVDGETGWRVKPGDPADLARAIGAYLGLSTAERQNMGRKARTNVERQFTKSGLQRATLEVYQSLLSGE